MDHVEREIRAGRQIDRGAGDIHRLPRPGRGLRSALSTALPEASETCALGAGTAHQDGDFFGYWLKH